MKKGMKIVLLGLLLLSLILLTGCFFNIFQTARTVGKGDVALCLGSAAMNLAGEGDYNWIFTPQGRLAIGLADNVDLGVRSGVMIGASGEPGFLGVVGDIKIALLQDPESFSLALGFGGGYSPGLLGWGIEGSIYFDSNLRFLPFYFVYRPLLPLAGDGFAVQHQLAAGLHLDLSEHARILVEIDSWGGLLSGGIALEIAF